MNMFDPIETVPASGLDISPDGDNSVDNVTLADLAGLVRDLRSDISGLQRTHNEILTIVGEVKAQAGPMLEKLSKSPLLSMFGGK